MCKCSPKRAAASARAEDGLSDLRQPVRPGTIEGRGGQFRAWRGRSPGPVGASSNRLRGRFCDGRSKPTKSSRTGANVLQCKNDLMPDNVKRPCPHRVPPILPPVSFRPRRPFPLRFRRPVLLRAAFSLSLSLSFSLSFSFSPGAWTARLRRFGPSPAARATRSRLLRTSARARCRGAAARWTSTASWTTRTGRGPWRRR